MDEDAVFAAASAARTRSRMALALSLFSSLEGS